ncbi:SdrD B-like domain-containing protein [Hydrogenophaga sp.]|uniref:SdrD B-like domain-containing protein n=1 Tax=Hydrogenophaga sp. TaxID=1904254 RepID=UPI003F6AA422
MTLSNAGSVTVTFTPVVVVNGVTSTLAAVTLAPGQSTQSTPISVPLTSTGATVTAIVSAPSVPDSNPSNNTDTEIAGTVLADVTTEVDLPANAPAGTVVTGTVVFTNSAGAGTTASATVGTVTLSNGQSYTYTVGELAPGASVTRTFTTTVPSTLGTVLEVTSTVGTSTPESNTANNTDVDNQAGGEQLTPLFSDPGVNVNPIPAGAPGTTVSTTVTLSNAGSVTVTFTTTVVVNGVTTTLVNTLAPGQTESVILSVPMTSTGATVTATITDSSVPDSNLANNRDSQSKTLNASLSGRVWLDTNGNGDTVTYEPGVDVPLSSYLVELLQGNSGSPIVVATALTAADGSYKIVNQTPGTDYSVRFKNPSGEVVVSTPFNQAKSTEGGNASTGTTTTVLSGGAIVAGAINNVTLYAGDNVVEQNLPIDPSGRVYDAVTRQTVAGAIVTLIGPNGQPVDGSLLVQGASTMTTAADGHYRFDLLPGAPEGRYRLGITAPSGYLPVPASSLASPGVAPGLPAEGSILAGGVFQSPLGFGGEEVAIQPNVLPPSASINAPASVGSPGTQYFLEFVLAPNRKGVVNNHIPLDPLGAGVLLVSKAADKSVAELGDSLRYTIRVQNTSGVLVPGVVIEDALPAGFRYIPGTARLGDVAMTDPAGAAGRSLVFALGDMAASATVEFSYFVRLGVGSQQGDGTNRAVAVFNGPSGPVRSNTAAFKVKVQGGVFSNEGCIVGKVYVDCDGNHAQNNVGGSREIGIPGVRLVMLDGSYVVTDSEGKYSVCGVKSQTHVIKVDRSTLPKGARMLPSSNRNAGDGNSLFVDMKGGEMARADFIEGSCSVDVMDQTKVRRAQGSIFAPEAEKGADYKLQPGGEMPAQQILPATRQDSVDASVQGRAVK